jgi:hypothetical protein
VAEGTLEVALDGPPETGAAGGGGPGRAGCVGGRFILTAEGRPGDRRRPPGRRAPGRGGTGRDRGSVTAELAAALPALMLLLVAGVMAVSVVGVKIRCVSAARDGALGQARGDSGVDAARRVAPDGAAVTVTVDGDLARATVSTRVEPFGGLLPAVTVSASAVAAMEPGSP